MAREKEDFRENLEQIYERFGNVQLIPLKEVAKFVGIYYRQLQADKDFPIKKIGGRYYAPAVSLARWLS